MDAPRNAQPRVLISRTALLHNIKLIRGAVREGVKVCAMVKADAYGHGAAVVADTLTNFSYEGMEAPATDLLAVVTLEEAEAIGQSVAPILVLRPVENIYIGRERERLGAAIGSGWILTVTSLAAVSDVAKVAAAMGRRAAVQVMIDTGQAREGAAVGNVASLVAAIDAQPSLRLAGLATHFVSSEEAENPINGEQLARFRVATDGIVAGRKILRSAANTGAIFLNVAAHLDMVRPGIGLYGIDPTCRPAHERALRPAMKWVAPLIAIRDIARGAAVGYGQTWTAQRDSRIGLVPVGYADGYIRAFSPGGKMIVRGQAAPVVGRISMDYTTVDLTDVRGRLAIGEQVTVLDSDPLSAASVYALAKLANTIPYELFCHIGGRIPRMAAEPEESAVRGTIYRMRIQKQAV